MNQVKQNEKNSALFTEVVRLGEEHEKHAQNLQGINQELQTRLAAIESKASIFDSNFQAVGEWENSSNNLMNDLAEKMEKRMHNMEEMVSLLNNENRVGKDQTQRLEVNSLKTNDEFRTILG